MSGFTLKGTAMVAQEGTEPFLDKISPCMKKNSLGAEAGSPREGNFGSVLRMI